MPTQAGTGAQQHHRPVLRGQAIMPTHHIRLGRGWQTRFMRAAALCAHERKKWRQLPSILHSASSVHQVGNRQHASGMKLHRYLPSLDKAYLCEGQKNSQAEPRTFLGLCSLVHSKRIVSATRPPVFAAGQGYVEPPRLPMPGPPTAHTCSRPPAGRSKAGPLTSHDARRPHTQLLRAPWLLLLLGDDDGFW